MQTVSASDAKNKFGELLDKARVEPVRVQKNGRDVAVVMSPEEFDRLLRDGAGTVSPAVKALHAKSAKRWGKVYKALAQ